MQRSLALLAVAASILRAAPARSDPLDIDLRRLRAPSADVLAFLARGPGATPTQVEYQNAADARKRFALLATQLGLALDSFVLSPPASVGHSGFEFGFEFAYSPVKFDRALFAGASPFQTRTPATLLFPAFHVRKALPYSFEIGGRVLYMNQSTHLAGQLEARWALNEGFYSFPDLALRAAVTQLFGVHDLDLGTYDLDVTVGKRFGVGGVMSLTPYAVLRVTWLHARSASIQYGDPAPTPQPQDVLQGATAFPELGAAGHRFLRYALGGRLVTAAVTVTVEGTFSPGRTFEGPAPAQLGAAGYPTFEVPSSFSAALGLGFTF